MAELARTERAGVSVASAKPTDGDVVELYLANLDASDRTRRTYGAALRQYCSWLEQRGLHINEAIREDVLAYRDYLKGERKASTVNAYLTAVRSLYAWLKYRGAYPIDPTEGVKGLRKGEDIGRTCLSLEEARELLSGDAEGERGLRDAALINLMLRRGLRTIEVSRADVGDIRPYGSKTVLYVQGKRHDDKDAFVILSDECLEPISCYLKARGKVKDTDPLFASIGNRNKGGRMTTRSISRIVKDAYARHGIVDIHKTAHSLRHTAVTLSIEAGADVHDVQAMARHSDVSTTMGYYHDAHRLEGRAESKVDAILSGAC